MLDKINEAKKFINDLTSNKKIHTVIILGSGMSGFEKNYDIIHQVSYSDIPNFLQPSIEGHSGTLSIVEIEERYTAILSGRAHYYEGYPIQELVIPVRTFSSLGATNLILTNAAGGISSNYNPGDIVSITDHINLTGDNPLIGKNLDEFGPRFPDMSEVYSKQFLQIAESIAQNHFEFKTGIYAWFTGPTYETPAEVNFAKNIGADLVGMSTVPEVILARYLGLKVAALSVVTNMASGMDDQPLSHERTIKNAKKGIIDLKKLLIAFLKSFLTN